MEKFRKGDFIRLKNLANYQIDRFSGEEVNIFEILIIEDNYVEVRNCKSKIPVFELEPIQVNGKDDFKIYYDSTNVCASVVINPNNPVPVHRPDYTYYYDSDSFKTNTYLNKNFQNLIIDRGIQYVHEVQHLLLEDFNDKGLIIML